MNAFITGSRAYGTARPDSDLDVCVLMDQGSLDRLITAFGWPIRIGDLNIIPCTTKDEFAAWRNATDECIATRSRGNPMTKEHAIGIHETWRANLGVAERPGLSGGPENRVKDND